MPPAPSRTSWLSQDLCLPAWATGLAAMVSVLVTGQIGLAFGGLHANASMFWPGTAVTIAFLHLGGLRFWPVIAVAVFANNLLASSTLAVSAGLTLGSILEALAGAWLLQRLSTRFASVPLASHTLALVGTALLAPMISATIGILVIWFVLQRDPSTHLVTWVTWWAGNAIGAIVLLPALLSFRNDPLPADVTTGNVVRRTSLVGLLIGLLTCIVLLAPDGTYALFFVFPLLFIATCLLGGRGAKYSAVVLAIVCLYATSTPGGAFDLGTATDSRLRIDLLLAGIALTAVILPVFDRAGNLRVPGTVLLVGWLLSAWLFHSFHHERQIIDEQRFQNQINITIKAIDSRLAAYVGVLRSGAALYASSDTVEPDEWRRYVATLDTQRHYAGIVALGAIFPVPEQNRAALVADRREKVTPDFTIRSVPGGEPSGADSYVITLVEPLEPNRPALGLDIATERSRRRAAEQSRDTGLPQMSDRIVLVQDGQRRFGFIILLPMYRAGAPLATTEERRAALTGWVFATVISGRLLDEVFAQSTGFLEAAIYAGRSTDPASLSYTSTHDRASALQPFEFVTTTERGGRHITIGWRRGPAWVFAGNSAGLWVAGTSALATVLLAGLIFSLQTTGERAREIVHLRTEELRAANAKLQAEIAERARAEGLAQQARVEAEEANRAKSDFLANMSHELRTPMNSVLGFSEMLADSPIPDTQKKWAGLVHESGRSLLKIINDILDFSKIEAGKLKLETQQFPPASILRSALAALAPPAEAKRLPLLLESTLPTEILAIGDPQRFRQVLVHLLSNAVKFTAEGSVRLVATWEPAEDQLGFLRISVIDTGIGIGREQQVRIFEKFSQGDGSSTRQFGGTGLGLAISKRLVELMSGQIECTSEPGRGSTFTFRLPALRPPGTSVPPAAPERSAGAPLTPLGLRVLLAEDGPANQVFAADLLTALGCQVTIVGDGQAALDATATTDFDAILMDCQMPGLDGRAATRLIRAREATTGSHRVPIVALTGYALETDRAKCLAAGMDDYLSKPFGVRVLHQALSRVTPAPA